MKPKLPRYILSGGGTGGHIFPAIAIADEIKARQPQAEILFIGAKGRMEMERVPKAGYEIKGLWISGLQRSLKLSNLSFPFKLLSALASADNIIKAFQPDVVIGVGGYASGPTLRVATRRHIPTLIQEQNSFPGITNRLLSKKVNRICVAYEQMDRWFPAEKIILTGNPLRQKSIDIAGKKAEALGYFGLKGELSTVVVVGGSQGAFAINRALFNNLSALKTENIQMIWQTGNTYLSTASIGIAAQGLEEKVKAVAFIERMDLAYSVADLIVSRAGAMSIAEISAVGKPAILVPLPTAAEDHQTKNAHRLVAKNAARWVKNEEAETNLIPEIFQLLQNTDLLQTMSRNVKEFAQPEATKKIVDEILKLTSL